MPLNSSHCVWSSCWCNVLAKTQCFYTACSIRTRHFDSFQAVWMRKHCRYVYLRYISGFGVLSPVRARTLMVLPFNCKKYKNLTKNIYALGSQLPLMVLLFLTVDWPILVSYRSKENTLFSGGHRSCRCISKENTLVSGACRNPPRLRIRFSDDT